VTIGVIWEVLLLLDPLVDGVLFSSSEEPADEVLLLLELLEEELVDRGESEIGLLVLIRWWFLDVDGLGSGSFLLLLLLLL